MTGQDMFADQERGVGADQEEALQPNSNSGEWRSGAPNLRLGPLAPTDMPSDDARSGGPGSGDGNSGGVKPRADMGSGERARGGMRILGFGAAVGLGAAAGIGLLRNGPMGAAHTSDHPNVGQASSSAVASTASATGDQGHTAISGMDPQVGAAQPDEMTSGYQSQAVDGSNLVGHQPHPQPMTADGSGSTPQPPTPGGTNLAPQSLLTDPAGSTPQPLTPGGTDAVAPDLSAKPMLYDSAGHAVMTGDGAGHWQPIGNDSGASPAANTPVPVLYDSSGHPVAMTDHSGHVVPLSATAGQPSVDSMPIGHSPAPGTTGQQSPSAGGASQPQHQIAQTSPVTAGSLIAGTSTQEQSILVAGESGSRLMTDAETSEAMRKMTPEERADQIRKALTSNDIPLPEGGKLPELPDHFFDKDMYTFKYVDENGKEQTMQLNTLAAAIKVVELTEHFSHFKADISALDSAATKLTAKADDIDHPAIALALAFNKVDSMWDKLSDDLDDASDPYMISAQSKFLEMKHTLFGGSVVSDTSCYVTKGNIPIVSQAIRDQGIALREAASAIVANEKQNLDQFQMLTDDPRPAWEKARFLDGKDLAENGAFPPGYFDPASPSSPYYQAQK